jgi:hypothetical protein
MGGGLLWALPPGLIEQFDSERTGKTVFMIGVAAGAFWYVCSILLPTPRRVLVYSSCLSVLSLPLLVVFPGFMAAGFFILVPQPHWIQLLQRTALLFATFVWVTIDFQGFLKVLATKRYVEREFIEFDDHIEMRWERKTNIEPPPISDATLLGRLWNRHGLKLLLAIAPLSGAGYATSRLLMHAGGDEAVLLFLAVLGVPLCIAIFSKVVCTGYLNIYKVLQMELKTGKPVIFDHIPEEYS